MESADRLLKQIADNTLSTQDVEIRLSDIDAKLQTTNDLLRDILVALQEH